MDNEGLTQYTRIAISLAERIASGQLKEGDKLSGRSKLSPEYNVSPETIRRTLRLRGRRRTLRQHLPAHGQDQVQHQHSRAHAHKGNPPR